MRFPKPEPRPKKARKPLARYTRLRARGKTSHARRPRDFDYMGEVAKLPCAFTVLAGRLAAASNPCEGPIQVDHAFGRYRKFADNFTIPLCREHHRQKTGKVGGRGFMAGWSLALRRGWLTVAVAWARRAIAEMPAAARLRRVGEQP